MSRPDLLRRFQDCLRYKHARSWQKPLINPRRFLRNQLRARGLPRLPQGEPHVTSTFHLERFTVVSGEGVSREIESYGIFEDELTEAFLRLIQPGQVVVDIGMHLGYYTTLFAALVTERGEVHSFEPTPSTRELARRNVERFPQVTVHPEAMWSGVQTLPFRDFGLSWMAFNSFTDAKHADAPKPREFSVTTTTLDVLRKSLHRPVALIKIDAESAEQAILAGAQELLRSDQPVITLEVGDAGGLPASRPLVDHLLSRSYAAWEFEAGRFQRHSPRESYTYANLIFAPASRDLATE